jgi:hypothetical protein
MSIGNNKSYGNKGNNFPWQLQMLQGIQGIIDTLNKGELRTPVIIYETLPGSIPDGTYGFSIANIGGATGLVNGQTLDAGVTINFDPGVNNTLAGLPYDTLGTKFLITYMI